MQNLEEHVNFSEWRVCERPFRHVRASSVLKEPAASQVEAAFKNLLETETAQGRFLKSQKDYDARMLGFLPEHAVRFPLFLSIAWLDFIARLAGVDATKCVDGGLHHYPLNSRSGWIHTDLCSGYFDGSSSEVDGIRLPNRQAVRYFDGARLSPVARPQEFVRCATMIYYVDNPGWVAGDGGETGLYESNVDGQTSCVKVPPLSNSLFIFECSPHSYHKFLNNPRKPRNSIILWLHSTVESASRRWGRAVRRRG